MLFASVYWGGGVFGRHSAFLEEPDKGDEVVVFTEDLERGGFAAPVDAGDTPVDVIEVVVVTD